MRKKIKVKPSLPNTDSIHYGLLDDNCYECKNKNGCNNCKRAKMYVRKNDSRYKCQKFEHITDTNNCDLLE